MPRRARTDSVADKRQNKALKQLNKRTKNAGKKLDKVAADLGKAASDLAGIQGAVPTVISSLQTLGTAATQLKAGLEAAGAGLTLLKDNFTGYVSGAEYGVVSAAVGGTPAAGALLVGPDIPDDANMATVSGTVPVLIPAGATNVPVTLHAAIRSGEKDGTGAANPAGVAGLVSMSVTAPAGVGVTVAGGNTPASVPLTSAPNAALNGLPVYPIADKAPRVDATPNPFAFPLAQSIDLTAPATLAPLGAPATVYTASNAGPNPAPALVTFTVRFHDLTASATDLNE